MTDAIIIGAGAAGLTAARELTHAGKRVNVLEASGRIGGRIFTTHDPLSGMPIELGAEFAHGEAKETTRLLEEARLATILVDATHHRSHTGRIESMGRAWTRMSLVFQRADVRDQRDHDELQTRQRAGGTADDEIEILRLYQCRECRVSHATYDKV